MKKLALAMLLAALERLLKTLALDEAERGPILGLLANAQAEIDADGDGVPDSLERKIEELEFRLHTLEMKRPDYAGKAVVQESPFVDVFADGVADVNVDGRVEDAPLGGVVTDPNQ